MASTSVTIEITSVGTGLAMAGVGGAVTTSASTTTTGAFFADYFFVDCYLAGVATYSFGTSCFFTDLDGVENTSGGYVLLVADFLTISLLFNYYFICNTTLYFIL